MEKYEIKFPGVRKSAGCHACHGRGKVVRIGVPDSYHGVLGWSICVRCLGDLIKEVKGKNSSTLPNGRL